jgi:hypothetical protein
MKNDKTETFELEIVQPSALEAIERAQVDMQIATAKRFPRSLATVKQRMMDLATLDQETAESCFYKLNRSGRSIEGPSIRLAEIAASSFGNLRYGARIIGNDGKVIVAQGYCHDLETNVMSQVEVRRRITDRNGQTYTDDMQVVTGNAACAIAMRNAMFKIVPFAFVKPIFSAAKQAAVGDIKTLAERRTRMLKQFAALGVDEKRICATLQKGGIEEIGLEDLETLIGLYTAIKDGEQKIDEAFPVPISKPVIGKPETTAEPKEEKPRGKRTRRPRDDSKQKPPPIEDSAESTEIKKRLELAKFSMSDLIGLAVKMEWVDKPEEEDYSKVELDSFGPEKLKVFLEDWDTVVELLAK